MTYKTINKCKAGHHLVGYFLFNKKTLLSKTIGESLLIRSKVKDLGYRKGFEPFEASIEDIIYCMVNFEAFYSFDKISFLKFIELLKEFYPEHYISLKNQYPNFSKIVFEENDLIEINIKIINKNQKKWHN